MQFVQLRHVGSHAGRPPRVLLVEDEPELRAVVARYLEHRGCIVVRAGDGGEGLRAVLRSGFHAVITDLERPEHDGRIFWREAVTLVPGLRGRFLFCSAAPRSEAMAEAAATERFLGKPFELDELWAALALRRIDGP